MKFNTIRCELFSETGVCVITMNRPNELNAMSAQMFRELTQLLVSIDGDPDVRCVVLTGEGRAFSSGGDLAEMKAGFGGHAGFYRHMQLANRFLLTLAELNKPVIAAINGAAMGAGMNTALACDILIASEKAKFSEVFGNVGLSPDVGGTYLLARLVGHAKAKELVFSYKTIGAQEAKELGIVNDVVAPEQLMETVMAMAETIASGPTMAFAMAKRMINRSYEMDLATALHMEALSQTIAGNSDDHLEGVSAFFEKRPHQFKGQ